MFLGFSFLSLNMRLLASHLPSDLSPQRCWGTAYKTSEVDQAHAIRAISEVVRTRPASADGGAHWPRLDNMTCADFVMHNQRAFDFAN